MGRNIRPSICGEKKGLVVDIPLWAQILGALSGTLGGIGGLIAIFRQWQRDRWEGEQAAKKTDADVVTTLTASAVSMINELQERVNELHKRIAILEDQRERLVHRVECLEEENKQMREVIREKDARIQELETENKGLEVKVSRLERRVEELENGRHG